jgi:hypothetical protein
MKKFIQALLVNFALVVLGAHIFPSIINNDWARSKFVLELLLVTVVIRLLLLLTNKFSSHYPILEYLLELGMILAVVLGFGWLFRWYDLARLWMMVAIVVAVYAAVYAVGIGKMRRDVAFINKQIKLRKKEISSE